MMWSGQKLRRTQAQGHDGVVSERNNPSIRKNVLDFVRLFVESGFSRKWGAESWCF